MVVRGRHFDGRGNNLQFPRYVPYTASRGAASDTLFQALVRCDVIILGFGIRDQVALVLGNNRCAFFFCLPPNLTRPSV